jgi:histidine decarboxylase
LTPLFLWSAIRKLGRSGFREMVVACLKMADYAIERFREEGIDAWRNNNSVTVVFPRPAPSVLKKWQIAASNDIGHMITMPHVTRELVDELVRDIAEVEP